MSWEQQFEVLQFSAADSLLTVGWELVEGENSV